MTRSRRWGEAGSAAAGWEDDEGSEGRGEGVDEGVREGWAPPSAHS